MVFLGRMFRLERLLRNQEPRARSAPLSEQCRGKRFAVLEESLANPRFLLYVGDYGLLREITKAVCFEGNGPIGSGESGGSFEIVDLANLERHPGAEAPACV